MVYQWKQTILRYILSPVLKIPSEASASSQGLISPFPLQWWELQGSIILTVSSCLAHSGFENLVVLCASGAGKVLIIPASVYMGGLACVSWTGVAFVVKNVNSNVVYLLTL